jgi:hypothetical protein
MPAKKGLMINCCRLLLNGMQESVFCVAAVFAAYVY